MSHLDRLEEVYLNGFADEETGKVEAPCGHAYRVGRSIVRTDNYGRMEDVHFPTVAEAEDYMHHIEREYAEWLNDDEGEDDA